MKFNCSLMGKACLLLVMLFFFGVPEARSDIQLTEDLSLAGWVRHMTAIHIGTQNPNMAGQTENYDLNLSRTMLQAELTYKPTTIFKLYTKFRVHYDQTDLLDDNIEEYDPFPLPEQDDYGSYLRSGDDDNVMAEIWEIYTDFNLDNLWLRLGKQQIAWGEMISIRILDMINPLDYSWHNSWEPEEFENIRMPQFMARAVYSLPPTVLPWFDDVYVEGFFNPGDVYGTNIPDSSSPISIFGGWASVFDVEKDYPRGESEYGGRIGYRIGQVAGTLNYAALHRDNPVFNYTMAGPPNWTVTECYPDMDVYGVGFNYAFDDPINVVVALEGKYIPDWALYDRDVTMGTRIKEVDYYKWGINFQRFTPLFTPTAKTPFANINLQYSQTIIPKYDEVRNSPSPVNAESNDVEEVNDALVLSMSQDFDYKTYKASLVIVYQLDGAYKINPGFKYSPGDTWRFELYGSWFGGSVHGNVRENSEYLSFFNWADEIYARVTFNF